ncbi:MAG: PilZ domain-containing protein [Fimbriimonadaceae bacterium]|nr:PilZ domain-containing protein [Fimbriimonadaceae bacterium]
MAASSPRDFNGVRTRYQRLGDCRFFTGWVQNFMGNNIVVQSSTDVVLTPGQEFLFQIFGANAMAIFTARLRAVDSIDMVKNAEFVFVEGTNAQVMSVTEMDFDFEITSQIRYSRATESVRRLVTTTCATITIEDQSPIEVMVADVAYEGIGFLSGEKFEPGAKCTVEIFSEYGVISAEGEIRYSRPDPRNLQTFRTGIQFAEMSRIDEAKWRRLMPRAA